MNQVRHSRERFWSGRRVLVWSLVLGAIGVTPLLLYIRFGPPDGNPIGLGLLAMISVPLATMGVVVGLLKLVIQAIVRVES